MWDPSVSPLKRDVSYYCNHILSNTLSQSRRDSWSPYRKMLYTWHGLVNLTWHVSSGLRQQAFGFHVLGMPSLSLEFSNQAKIRLINACTISVFNDIIANICVLSSLLYSYIVVLGRHLVGGPWVVHVVCFLSVLLASYMQTFFNTTSVLTGVQNFLNFDGTIVGIMKVHFSIFHLITPSIGIDNNAE